MPSWAPRMGGALTSVKNGAQRISGRRPCYCCCCGHHAAGYLEQIRAQYGDRLAAHFRDPSFLHPGGQPAHRLYRRAEVAGDVAARHGEGQRTARALPPRIAVGQTALEDRHALVRLLLTHRHHAPVLNGDFAPGHAYQPAQRGHPGQQEVGPVAVSAQMFERSGATAWRTCGSLSGCLHRPVRSAGGGSAPARYPRRPRQRCAMSRGGPDMTGGTDRPGGAGYPPRFSVRLSRGGVIQLLEVFVVDAGRDAGQVSRLSRSQLPWRVRSNYCAVPRSLAVRDRGGARSRSSALPCGW